MVNKRSTTRYVCTDKGCDRYGGDKSRCLQVFWGLPIEPRSLHLRPLNTLLASPTIPEHARRARLAILLLLLRTTTYILRLLLLLLLHERLLSPPLLLPLLLVRTTTNCSTTAWEAWHKTQTHPATTTAATTATHYVLLLLLCAREAWHGAQAQPVHIRIPYTYIAMLHMYVRKSTFPLAHVRGKLERSREKRTCRFREPIARGHAATNVVRHTYG